MLGRLLRDGTLIVLHDDTLERTAAPDAAPAYRALVRTPVRTLRLADVSHVDVGSWFGREWKDERPPLFSDVLEELRRAVATATGAVDAQCFAELKGDRPHDPALPQAAAAVVSELCVPASALTWISFSLPLLTEMKRLCRTRASPSRPALPYLTLPYSPAAAHQPGAFNPRIRSAIQGLLHCGRMHPCRCLAGGTCECRCSSRRGPPSRAPGGGDGRAVRMDAF